MAGTGEDELTTSRPGPEEYFVGRLRSREFPILAALEAERGFELVGDVLLRALSSR
jgi:hypothetical protein